MKNLVLGVATGYDWYKLEPFVTSFKRYSKNTDLVLFVDNISDFTRATLTGGGAELLPVPAEFKSAHIVAARWGFFKNFLDERGKYYNQVLIPDVRDLIFQGDVFEKYADLQNFLGYTLEDDLIKNPTINVNYNWITNLFSKDEADKLAEKQIICSGTVLGTVEEVKICCEKIYELVKNCVTHGSDQAALNYIIYEKLLPIENIIEIDCYTGNILTAYLYHKHHPFEIKEGMILRGDGGIPAVVHQYDRQRSLIELVDKLYRDKNFQPNEKFSDMRSMFEQIFHLANLNRIDDIYKLFTKHLFGKNFVGNVDKLVTLWELTLLKNFTPSSELLILSIQSALMSTNTNGFNFGHINKMVGLLNFCMKNNLVVSYSFKLFMGNILFSLANQLHTAKQYDQCIMCLNFIDDLDTPKDSNFYLFQAKVYRESGKKAEAMAAYEKVLSFY